MRLRCLLHQPIDNSDFRHAVGDYVGTESDGAAVDSDEAFPFQMQNDLLRGFLR